MSTLAWSTLTIALTALSISGRLMARLLELELEAETKARHVSEEMLLHTRRFMLAAERACNYHERERQKREREIQRLRRVCRSRRLNESNWGKYLAIEREVREKAGVAK